MLSELRQLVSRFSKNYATVAGNRVNIVEVGPRDGLQNEPGVIPLSVKIELLNRLGRSGLQTIGAFHQSVTWF
jgi:hydroxymethylglutaryl-CoA lyase